MPQKITYSFRMSRDVKDKVKARAGKHNRSLNAHVQTILEEEAKGELVNVTRISEDPAFKAIVSELYKHITKDILSDPEFQSALKDILEAALSEKQKST